MTQFHVELPEEAAAALGRLAALHETTPEQLLAAAARDLLAEVAGLEQAIAEGEADLAAGRVVDFDNAMTDIDAMILKAANRRQVRQD
jgi:predicted transcriptional regulator